MEFKKFSDTRQNTKMELRVKIIVSITSRTEQIGLFVFEPSSPLK